MRGQSLFLLFPSPLRGGSPSDARRGGGEPLIGIFCAVTPPGARVALATLPVKGREEKEQ
jgi:hypothetical protein